MRYTLLIVICVFLCGCGHEPSHTADSHKEKAPVHHVVFLNEYYLNFLKAAKADFSNRDKMYVETVKDALIKDHFLTSEYGDLVLEDLAQPVHDTSGLATCMSEIDANRAPIEAVISSAFARCNSYLKNDNVTFYIAPATYNSKERIIQMGGVSGLTAGSKQIIITIDPGVGSWKEMLAYTIAHEFNHAYWTAMNFNYNYQLTLLRYLVFEGKADSFAHLLYPKAKSPWVSCLTAAERRTLWNKIKPDLQSDDPVLLSNVMFGSEHYPVWGGYALGYDLVQTAFHNHHELLSTNWTNLDAEKLLKLSSYKAQ